MKRTLFTLSTLLATSTGHASEYFLPLAATCTFIGGQTLIYHTVSRLQQNEKNDHPTNNQQILASHKTAVEVLPQQNFLFKNPYSFQPRDPSDILEKIISIALDGKEPLSLKDIQLILRYKTTQIIQNNLDCYQKARELLITYSSKDYNKPLAFEATLIMLEENDNELFMYGMRNLKYFLTLDNPNAINAADILWGVKMSTLPREAEHKNCARTFYLKALKAEHYQSKTIATHLFADYSLSKQDPKEPLYTPEEINLIKSKI